MEITEIQGLNDEQIAAITKLVQSETDKVRTDYSQKLKLANEELTKLKPVEKTDAEKDLEERLKALENKEAELNAKERKNTITSKLKERGIPEELSAFISVGENMDEDIEKVGNAFGKYFLNSNFKPESHSNNKGITKDQFARMSYMERTKLFQENPALYKMLSE